MARLAKRGNPVAKHSTKFNKSKIEPDKRKRKLERQHEYPYSWAGFDRPEFEE